MPNNGEASVEEILDSIKKVIARDNRETAMNARRRRQDKSEIGPTSRRAQILALTPEESSDTADDVLDLAEMEFVHSDQYSSEDVVGDIDSESADPEDLDPRLTNDAVRDAIHDNLEALAMLAQPGAQPQIVRSGETSLEELTRQMLRPMLAEWLDQNLPGMVEKLVQAEIARIASKRG